MTMNVLIATRDYAICASDQRLTLPSGKIVTERSMKVTAFQCRDIIGLITYNGIGRDQNGRTPNDWILEIDNLSSLNLVEIAERMKELAERKIAALPDYYKDRRHSFFGIGFLLSRPLRPFLFCISNYENLRDVGHLPTPKPQFEAGYLADNGQSTRATALCLAGDTRWSKKQRFIECTKALKAPVSAMKARKIAENLIRSAAFSGSRKSTIGSRVSWGIVHSDGHQEIGGNVIGGTKVLESPNLILPGLMVADIYMQGFPPANGSRYNRVTRRFDMCERPCPSCNNPVPEGDRLCGVCGCKVGL